MKWYIETLLIASTSCAFFDSSSNSKSLAVDGRLKCGNGPAANVKVILFPKDTGSGPDPPDQFGSAISDSQGNFRISGTLSTEVPIDAVLKFYHSCNNNKPKLGLRKASVKIPSDYVTNGRAPLKTFHTGTINLELGFPGEERHKPSK
ncbi:Transthyretin-like protein 46 [Toxocara canis]|uniref:Transthyretin-like protein 46 n=1 Tax=Toxocara canis TaxID=6265 RepID=A0A0B2W1Z5_TOXCA|nr:Transthyretin-like protein 46 [Toxocara canis]